MFIILKFVTLEKRFNELYPVVCKMRHRKIILEVYVIIVFRHAYFEQHLQSIMLSFFQNKRQIKVDSLGRKNNFLLSTQQAVTDGSGSGGG